MSAESRSPFLPVVLTTQELLPGKSGGFERNQEPVTVGIPLADQQGISDLRHLALVGSPVSQFRCLAKWPSGNCKWVQVDYQLPHLRAGEKSDAVRVMVAPEPSPHAAQNLATDRGPIIEIDTGANGCVFAIRKANFDGLHSVVCNGKPILAEGGEGLVIRGPTFRATPEGATCVFNSTCTGVYRSSADSSSTCVIEEAGPVRTSIRCSGSLEDASGNKYMGFLVRMHFFAGKRNVKLVATLKNADDGVEGSFPISYKGYQSLEFVLRTALTASNRWVIGNESRDPTAGAFTGTGQSAYIYQGYAQAFYDRSYSQNSRKGIADIASDIPRSTTGGNSKYSQCGYVIVDLSSSVRRHGASALTPQGWVDVQDSHDGRGIEVGAAYMAANFPKSLQITNSGQEIHVGISPDQNLWTGACDATVSPCRKIYYQAWPAYKVADLFLIFHDRDLGSPGSSEEFLRMQAPLVARAPVDYYNQTGVFTYPILHAAEEDAYFNQLAQSHGIRGWAPLEDIVPLMPRWFSWAAGSSANQVEYRYADLVHRWLARGHTGRYLYGAWFVRFQEQFGWPRADQFQWASHSPSSDLTPYDGYPSRCSQDNTCSDSGGMLPNNAGLAYQDLVGASDNSAWGHGHWWSLISYYYMTGDEDANDLLKDGVVTEFAAVAGNGSRTMTSLNNLSWQTSGANSKLASARSIATHAAGTARYWQYLSETGADRKLIDYVRTALENQVTLIEQEPCATTGTGASGPQAGPTYPEGCLPVYDGGITARQTRGSSAYRGFGLGPAEQDDSGRCKAVPGNDLVSGQAPALYTRCIKAFMEGIWVDGLWTVAQILGRDWEHFNRIRDLAYGAALNTDHDLYVERVAPANFPSPGQLVDRIAMDQPNQMSWDAASDGNGRGPPFEGVYRVLGLYTGDSADWRKHWEGTFLNRGAGQSYNSNNLEEYGSQVTAEVVDLILHPPQERLVSVPVAASASSCQTACQWELSWASPQKVVGYYLKWDEKKTIVENVGWNAESNRPSGDPAHTVSWFAAQYCTEQPSFGAQTLTVTAPSSAKFALKALVKRF